MGEPLTQAEEEEMSSAYIAKLLAEDAMGDGGNVDYYAEYSNSVSGYDPYHAQPDDDEDYADEGEDDSYAPKRKTKGRGRTAKSSNKRGRKRKATDAEEETPSGEQETSTKIEDSSSSGAGAPSADTEAVESLVAHIATRDANSIRSHAQKHFIKLFRDQVPLPEKVRETGDGYTLSGKPLDPESSAAKPYLGRGSTSAQLPKPAKPIEKKEEPKNTASTTVAETLTVIAEASNKEATETITADLKKRPISPSVYDENGRTDYSKRKLRRARERPSVMYSQISKDDDPLTMVKCEPFTGKPGSEVNGSQPFEMEVHSNVMLAMDFHAHLMTTEIIGFLAGEWDKDKKKMCIKEAFPCRSLNTGQNDVNVEMDPTSDIETRQLIHDKNLTVVGWYHSHPTFVPDPSITDLENQRNYQILCREKCESLGRTFEPFVGAIVGPYDPRLPGSASVINWFYVSNSLDERWIPKRLVYELQEDTELSTEHSERLLRLLDEYKNSPEKVDFNDMWRQDMHESKLEKLIKSLGARMPWAHKTPDQIDSFLTSIRDKLREW
ncbi:hypothetical protein BX666DRAFT_1863795 [Dichotomocladium elegans]|nr:hypothetical protein BX666DRAFT_1863795 [Dichotomocladium elegans]